MGQDHTYLAPRFQVQVGYSAKEQRGDVLIGSLSSAYPDVIGALAKVHQFFADDIGAFVVGQPRWIAHDGVNALFGDDGRPHHVTEVVCPYVVSVDGLQFSHLIRGLRHRGALDAIGYLVFVEHNVRVSVVYHGLRQIEQQGIEAIAFAGEGHRDVEGDGIGLAWQLLCGSERDMAGSGKDVALVTQLEGVA